MRKRAKRFSSAFLDPLLSILLILSTFLVFVLLGAVERGCAMLEFLSPRAVSEKSYRWVRNLPRVRWSAIAKNILTFRCFASSLFRSFAMLVFFGSINSR